MEVGFIVALVLAIPLVLFPAALVWYLNFGGIRQAAKARAAKAILERKTG